MQSLWRMCIRKCTKRPSRGMVKTLLSVYRDPVTSGRHAAPSLGVYGSTGEGERKVILEEAALTSQSHLQGGEGPRDGQPGQLALPGDPEPRGPPLQMKRELRKCSTR